MKRHPTDKNMSKVNNLTAAQISRKTLLHPSARLLVEFRSVMHWKKERSAASAAETQQRTPNLKTLFGVQLLRRQSRPSFPKIAASGVERPIPPPAGLFGATLLGSREEKT